MTVVIIIGEVLAHALPLAIVCPLLWAVFTGVRDDR